MAMVYKGNVRGLHGYIQGLQGQLVYNAQGLHQVFMYKVSEATQGLDLVQLVQS